MSEPGKIRNRKYAQQIKDFSGLVFGKISPTDIDGFLEFGNRLFVFIEGKHAGAMIATGQRLALERVVDAIHCPPRRIATVIIVDHRTDGDIDMAVTSVRTYRFNRKWHQPLSPINLKDVIKRFQLMADRMCHPVL